MLVEVYFPAEKTFRVATILDANKATCTIQFPRSEPTQISSVLVCQCPPQAPRDWKPIVGERVHVRNTTAAHGGSLSWDEAIVKGMVAGDDDGYDVEYLAVTEKDVKSRSQSTNHVSRSAMRPAAPYVPLQYASMQIEIPPDVRSRMSSTQSGSLHQPSHQQQQSLHSTIPPTPASSSSSLSSFLSSSDLEELSSICGLASISPSQDLSHLICIGPRSALETSRMVLDLYFKRIQAVATLHQSRSDMLARLSKEKTEKGILLEFPIETKLIGMAVGKAGVNVKEASKLPGVHKVSIKEDGTVSIVAESEEAANAARALVEYVDVSFPVSEDEVAWVIGPKGAHIKELQEKSGAVKMAFRERDSCVQVIGTYKQAEAARQLLLVHTHYLHQQREILKDVAHLSKSLEGEGVQVKTSVPFERRPPKQHHHNTNNNNNNNNDDNGSNHDNNSYNKGSNVAINSASNNNNNAAAVAGSDASDSTHNPSTSTARGSGRVLRGGRGVYVPPKHERGSPSVSAKREQEEEEKEGEEEQQVAPDNDGGEDAIASSSGRGERGGRGRGRGRGGRGGAQIGRGGGASGGGGGGAAAAGANHATPSEETSKSSNNSNNNKKKNNNNNNNTSNDNGKPVVTEEYLSGQYPSLKAIALTGGGGKILGYSGGDNGKAARGRVMRLDTPVDAVKAKEAAVAIFGSSKKEEDDDDEKYFREGRAEASRTTTRGRGGNNFVSRRGRGGQGN